MKILSLLTFVGSISLVLCDAVMKGSENLSSTPTGISFATPTSTLSMPISTAAVIRELEISDDTTLE